MLKHLRYNLSKQVVYRLFTVLLYLNLIYCSSVYPLSTMKSTGSSSSCSECKPTPEPLPENIPSFYQRKLPETWYVLFLNVLIYDDDDDDDDDDDVVYSLGGYLCGKT